MAPHCTPPLTPELAAAVLQFVDRLTWSLNLAEQVQDSLTTVPALREQLPVELARHLRCAQRALLRAWDSLTDVVERAEDVLDGEEE